MSDLVIIQDPTDKVKNLPKSILTYLYKKICNSYNLKKNDIKIVDIEYKIEENQLNILFNINFASPKGMVILNTIPYTEIRIMLRREKILKIQKL